MTPVLIFILFPFGLFTGCLDCFSDSGGHTCWCLQKPDEGTMFPRAVVTGGYELSDNGAEKTLGCLEEQQALLATKTSLQKPLLLIFETEPWSYP